MDGSGATMGPYLLYMELFHPYKWIWMAENKWVDCVRTPYKWRYNPAYNWFSGAHFEV